MDAIEIIFTAAASQGICQECGRSAKVAEMVITGLGIDGALRRTLCLADSEDYLYNDDYFEVELVS